MAKFIPVGILMVCLASANILHAQELTKPLGKWERKIGKSHITLTVEENRLHIRFSSGDVSGSAHADYSMTRDGVLFGIVTSLECDDEEKEAEGTKEFYNAPFSFRFRIDEGALVISDARTVYADSKNDEQLNGRFKAVNSATRAAIIPSAYYTLPPKGPQISSSPVNNHNPFPINPLPFAPVEVKSDLPTYLR